MTKPTPRNETARSAKDTIPAPPPEHLLAATRVPGRTKRSRTREESGLLKIIREVLANVA